MSAEFAYEAADAYRIAGRLFEADSPRAIVVALHGARSHGEWYLESAAFLAERGYAVVLLDRRGSGLNRDRDAGDAPSAGILLSDVERAVAEARRRIGALPVVLMGISWGGKLAACYAARRGDDLAGLILSAPGIAAKADLPLGRKLLVTICRLVAPRVTFALPLEAPELFTANPERIAYLKQDRLSLLRATARFLVTSRMLDVYLTRRVDRIRVPTLMTLAGHDDVVHNEGLRVFFGKLACPKTLVVMEKAHHTLEFDEDRDAYFDTLVKWLDETIGAGAAGKSAPMEGEGS